ncbi:hypothetical protein D3C77_374970 [compost metagenome]
MTAVSRELLHLLYLRNRCEAGEQTLNPYRGGKSNLQFHIIPRTFYRYDGSYAPFAVRHFIASVEVTGVRRFNSRAAGYTCSDGNAAGRRR